MEAHRENSTPYASPIYFFSQQLASCVCFFFIFVLNTIYIYVNYVRKNWTFQFLKLIPRHDNYMLIPYFYCSLYFGVQYD